MNLSQLEQLISKPIDDHDLKLLKEQVWLENGLINDNIRIKVWPMFLSTTIDNKKPNKIYKQKSINDYQIEIDIERSVNHLDRARKLTEKQVTSARNDLKEILRSFFIEEPNLHYYQGFHDIAEFLYLIGGPQWCAQMLKPISYLYLFDNLVANPLYSLFLLYNVYSIVAYQDKKFADYLLELDSEPPIYFLSFFNTLFVHDIINTRTLSRFFDILLVSHPLLVLYLIASILIHKRDEIYASEDPYMMVRTLKQMIQLENLPVEALIKEAHFLYTHYPPSTLLYNYNYYYQFIPKSSIYICYDTLFKDNRLNTQKLYDMDPSLLSSYSNSIPLDTFNSKIYINKRRVGFESNEEAKTFVEKYFPDQKHTIFAVSALGLGIAILSGVIQYFSESK